MRAYTLFWLVLMVVAVTNGIIRQATYGRVLPELVAHQVATGTGMLTSALCVWIFARYVPIRAAGTALIIGVLWLGMTVSFEFVFGHWVAGHSWDRLLFDYNIAAGRLWSVFLIWIALLPYFVFRLSANRPHRHGVNDS